MLYTNRFIWLFLILTLGVGTYYSYQAYTVHKTIKILKEDAKEINKMNYHLFNIHYWKEEALRLFSSKIDEFSIDPKAYHEVELELEKYLFRIYKDYIESGKLFDRIFEDAEKKNDINPMILSMVKANVAPQIQKLNLPKFIPSMAHDLANELKEQEPRLRDIMHGELRRMIQYSPDQIKDKRVTIYQKYGVETYDEADAIIWNKVEKEELKFRPLWQKSYLILLIGTICALICMRYLGIQGAVLASTVFTFIWLGIGVTLPMITLDASLNAFDLQVLGSTISFDKQTMYYQSKSILEVTKTLLDTGGLDLKIVGLMILCFSIIFPIIKLILSVGYIIIPEKLQYSFVKGMIFYLGKWSMADVFVVALFMAYIGFYGLLNAQLADIGRNRNGFAVETINESSLSVGALYFTTYCVFSIIIGIIINKRSTSMLN